MTGVQTCALPIRRQPVLGHGRHDLARPKDGDERPDPGAAARPEPLKALREVSPSDFGMPKSLREVLSRDF